LIVVQKLAWCLVPLAQQCSSSALGGTLAPLAITSNVLVTQEKIRFATHDGLVEMDLRTGDVVRRIGTANPPKFLAIVDQSTFAALSTDGRGSRGAAEVTLVGPEGVRARANLAGANWDRLVSVRDLIFVTGERVACMSAGLGLVWEQATSTTEVLNFGILGVGLITKSGVRLVDPETGDLNAEWAGVVGAGPHATLLSNHGRRLVYIGRPTPDTLLNIPGDEIFRSSARDLLIFERRGKMCEDPRSCRPVTTTFRVLRETGEVVSTFEADGEAAELVVARNIGIARSAVHAGENYRLEVQVGAYDLLRGTRLWRRSSRSVASIGTCSECAVVALVAGRSLSAVDLRTGAELWARDIP
jgi:hypothetical protein